MKINTASIFPALILAFGMSYYVQSFTQMKEVSDTSALITHLAKEAGQPDFHSAGDQYLLVQIGKKEYVAELETAKVVDERNVETGSGGICENYAEVNVRLLDKDRHETSQGASQILKVKNGKWKQVALSEGDYSCEKLKGIPKSVLACLKVECNGD